MAPVSAPAEYITLSRSVSSSLCRRHHAAMQAHKRFNRLFQSLLAVKSGDGRKGPACSPVPQRSADGLLYELAAPCIIAGPPFHSHPTPYPRSIPEASRVDRQAADHRLFVPVCQNSLSCQKKKKKTLVTPQGLGGPVVICGSRLYEVTRRAWPTR